MDNSLNDLLSMDFNIETEEVSEIEGELSQYTSLIYNIDKKEYYVDNLDVEEGENYQIPFIPTEWSEKDTLEFSDYTVTKKDIDDFVKLVEREVSI